MENHSKHWIRTILKELSQLNNEQGKTIIEKCGRECSNIIGSAKQAVEIRENISDKKNIDLLLAEFKKNVFTQCPLYRKGDKIYLEYLHKECPCPMVKEAEIKDPFICNCTVGHAKSIFEALFAKEVNIELEKSIMKGDELCRQIITIID